MSAKYERTQKIDKCICGAGAVLAKMWIHDDGLRCEYRSSIAPSQPIWKCRNCGNESHRKTWVTKKRSTRQKRMYELLEELIKGTT